ncbi:MAG: hypothetical protein ABUT39_07535 [Acidobacteriota bacterium]
MSQYLAHIAEVKPLEKGVRMADYDLLVLDKETCAASGRELAGEALKGGTAVLVLNAGDEEKKILHEVIGFRSEGPGAAYLVLPLRDSAGRAHFRIFEQRYPTRLQKLIRVMATGEGDGLTDESEPVEIDLAQEEDSEHLFELSQEQLKAFGDRVRDLLRSRQTLVDPAPGVPDGLKTMIWFYDQDQSFTAAGTKSKVGTPKPQYLSCFTTYEFQAFLNDWPVTGAFQYLYLRQSGIYQTNGMVKNNSHERGWYLTQLSPSFAAPSELFYYQSSPANTSGSKQVTTSTGFQVDFNSGGSGASYNFSSSTTETIYEWQIIQQTGNAWQYFQATPYSGTTTSFPSSAVESNDKGEIKPMPVISRYSLQFDVQAVWKTRRVLREALPVSTYNYLRADYIKTEYESGTKWHGTWWYSPSDWPATYYIDFALVS